MYLNTYIAHSEKYALFLITFKSLFCVYTSVRFSLSLAAIYQMDTGWHQQNLCVCVISREKKAESDALPLARPPQVV